MAWGRSYSQFHYLPTGGISLHEIVILASYDTAYSVVHPTGHSNALLLETAFDS